MEPIVKASVYRAVVQSILDTIKAGKIKPGEQLPSMKELCEELQVGISSVREGLRQLQSMGIIEIVQGKGTYVEEGVESHPGLIQPGRLALGIEIDPSISDEIPGVGKTFRPGHLPLSSGPPPEADHRANRHIERPAGLLRERLGPRKHPPEIVTNGNGPVRARSVTEPPQLALRIVVAHHAVEVAEASVGGRLGPDGNVLGGSVQYDADADGHLDLRELEAFQRRLGGRGQRRRTPRQAHQCDLKTLQWIARLRVLTRGERGPLPLA